MTDIRRTQVAYSTVVTPTAAAMIYVDTFTNRGAAMDGGLYQVVISLCVLLFSESACGNGALCAEINSCVCVDQGSISNH